MDCPNCGLTNPPSAQRCDCGYDFDRKRLPDSAGDKRASASHPSSKQTISPELAESATSENLTSLPPAEVIKAVVYDVAVSASILSLAIWGVINVGGWFLLGQDSKNLLMRLPDPNAHIFLLAYGAAIIGAIMLCLAALGAIIRPGFIILLDGLSLWLVGLWNVGHDFYAIIVLQAYGHYIKDYSIFFIMLGLWQFAWGSLQFRRFVRLGWRPKGTDPNTTDKAKQVLRQLVHAPTDPNRGRIECSISRRIMGIPLTHHYVALLLPDSVVFLEKALKDCFTASRVDIQWWEIK
jgi:hypothetical protein